MKATRAARLRRTVGERRRAWLGDAATWLGRAAALETSNDKVLVHLGRVQALLFDDAEALTTLRTVLARTPSNDARLSRCDLHWRRAR